MTPANTTTPFLRLDALTDWKRLTSEGLHEQDGILHLANVEIVEGNNVFTKPISDTDPAGSFGGRTTPTGIEISRQGDFYLADPQGNRILYTRASIPPVADPDDPAAPFVPLYQVSQHSQQEDPLRLSRPVDVALVPANAAPGTMADALVVAQKQGRLIWLDRHTIGLRHELALDSITVVGIGTDALGVVYVAGHDDTSGTGLLIRIVNGQPLRRTVLARIPAGVYVAPNGTALLFDATGVWAIGADGEPTEPDCFLASSSFDIPALVQNGDDLSYGIDGDACDPLVFHHIPLDRIGQLSGTALPVLTRPRKLTRPRSGSWLSGPFDGGVNGFAWHRITFDLQIPDQCRILVSTLASDQNLDLAEVTEIEEQEWSTPLGVAPNDITEVLIQKNKGRYLWLRIEAFGNGVDSAEIAGVNIYGPRDGQLSLLPAPFQQDRQTAEFLDKYLSLQDTLFTEVVTQFEDFSAVLLPHATPDEFLDWLGGWFDWKFMSQWSGETRRDMIRASFEFFEQRGTITGLKRMLSWHTGLSGPMPAILENYRLAKLGGQTVIAGQELELGTDEGAHRFTVVLPQYVAPDDNARAQIERIINVQKPAQTQHLLVLAAPGVQLASQAMLGVDAILGTPGDMPLGAAHLDGGLATTSYC